MGEKIKFTDDEVIKIKEFQQKYSDITILLGQLEVQSVQLSTRLMNIDVQRERVRSDLRGLQETEKLFAQEMEKKYGMGTVDSDTGEFTPSPTYK